jgi:hypothetical protein
MLIYFLYVIFIYYYFHKEIVIFILQKLYLHVQDVYEIIYSKFLLLFILSF